MAAPTARRRLGEMGFNAGAGAVNWFPGHMAAATRAIRSRLKLADLVVEIRDARIPLSSANADIQEVLAAKRRIVALNKKDLANPNIMHKWMEHFNSHKQDCLAITAHSRSSVNQLLNLVELRLKEAIVREPTLLVMVVGVPNVGKSCLINTIHQIAASRFPVKEKTKRATVGPLPGVTQDIAGFKISNHPSIYVLDTPGILVPNIPDVETGLKLALTGAIKDSVVGEERTAKYFLSVLNVRKTPLHWSRLVHMRRGSNNELGQNNESHINDALIQRRQPNHSDVIYIEDLVKEVQKTLYLTHRDFSGNLEEEADLETLINEQLTALRDVFKVESKAPEEANTTVSKKLLVLFRTGKLGPFILDTVPSVTSS